MKTISIRQWRILLVAMLGLFPVGCHRSHDHSSGEGDDHHHEDKTAQITVWSDRYEIFVEHRLVAAGRPRSSSPTSPICKRWNRDGNIVQALRGVGEDDRVVTKGEMAIRLAAASNVIPAHGHAH